MTIKLKLTVIAATVASITGAMLLPGTALAANTRQANAVAGAPEQATASGSVNGTIPGTSTACTSHWKWHISENALTGGYTEVEWTSNPCGFQIQDRSWCTAGVGGYWANSGIVKGVDIWDRANCELIAPIAKGQEHFRSPGGSWSAYKTYWSG